MTSESEPQPSAPTAPTMDAVVMDDLTCIGCGYNLRTLPHAGRCPECARRVWDSVTGADLRYAPHDYLRVLASSAHRLHRFCEIAVVLIGLLGAILVGAEARDEGELVLLAVPGIAGLVTYVATCFVLWQLATPDPRGTCRLPESPATRGLRIAVFGCLALPPSAVVFACAGVYAGSLVAAILGLVSALALPGLLAGRILSLATRMPHGDAGQHARDAARVSYVLLGLVFAVVWMAGPFTSFPALFIPPLGALVLGLLTWRRAFKTLARALEALVPPQTTASRNLPDRGAP